MRKAGYLAWIFMLVIELFAFYTIKVSVHSIDDILFIIVVIIVTLCVGIVGLLLEK